MAVVGLEMLKPEREGFLRVTPVIDWDQPPVLALAGELGQAGCSQVDVARACFEWVRDEIAHSSDHGLDPVTCSASDVLKERTGFCYAKSHLLAALLRANGIPAGFVYQRLALDARGEAFCLHGLNAVWLPEIGWYRIDPRGNRRDLIAGFDPPREMLP
jgi:transglutaminase-like putative cysteine protease